MGLGAWFAAIAAGYAADQFIAAAQAGRSRTLATAGLRGRAGLPRPSSASPSPGPSPPAGPAPPASSRSSARSPTRQRPPARRRSQPRPLLPARRRPMAALVLHPQHRPAHAAPPPAARPAPASPATATRPPTPGTSARATSPRRARLRRHHRPGPPDPRRPAPAAPLPHHPGRALRPAAPHGQAPTSSGDTSHHMTTSHAQPHRPAGYSATPARHGGLAWSSPSRRDDEREVRLYPAEPAVPDVHHRPQCRLPHDQPVQVRGRRARAMAVHAVHVTYVLYQMIGLPVNFTGRGFDLAAHQARILAWRPPSYPDVDIFLPICGEPVEVLRNTWAAVSDAGRELPGSGSARTSLMMGRPTRPGRWPSRSASATSAVPASACTRRRATCDTPSPAPAASTSSSSTPISRRGTTSWLRLLPYLDDPAVAIVQKPAVFPAKPGADLDRECRGCYPGGLLPVDPGGP